MTYEASNWLRPIGSTGLSTSAVIFGASPIGSVPEVFGRETSWNQARATLDEVFASPIRTIDTSNNYSDGESERRIGATLADLGGVPDDFLIITKVDGKDGDFSGDRVRRSLDESRERLGFDTFPLVHLHDPEFYSFDAITARGGALDALVALRDAGEIRHLGIAGGDTATIGRYVDLGVFDVLQTHNRMTLVDHSAEGLIDQAVTRGMAVFNAAIYGGGILANPAASDLYCYAPVKPEVRRAITQIQELCKRWQTNIADAALQFSLRDTRITATVIGTATPSRVAQIIEQTQRPPLPQMFWDELEELVPPKELWVDATA